MGLNSNAAPRIMEIFIKPVHSSIEIFCVTRDGSDPVIALKQQFEFRSGVPTEEQVLIFGGKQLQDDQTLLECGICEGSTVHLARDLNPDDSEEELENEESVTWRDNLPLRDLL